MWLGSREEIKFHACVATAAIQVFDMNSKGHPSLNLPRFYEGIGAGGALPGDKGAGKLKSGDQVVGWCCKRTTDYAYRELERGEI